MMLSSYQHRLSAWSPKPLRPPMLKLWSRVACVRWRIGRWIAWCVVWCIDGWIGKQGRLLQDQLLNVASCDDAISYECWRRIVIRGTRRLRGYSTIIFSVQHPQEQNRGNSYFSHQSVDPVLASTTMSLNSTSPKSQVPPGWSSTMKAVYFRSAITCTSMLGLEYKPYLWECSWCNSNCIRCEEAHSVSTHTYIYTLWIHPQGRNYLLSVAKSKIKRPLYGLCIAAFPAFPG